MWRLLLTLTLLLASTPASRGDAPADERWIDILGAIPIQEDGRVMPLDTYARNLAVSLTGRTHWSADRGPAPFADRHPIQLFCDLLYTPDSIARQPLIAVEHRPFKREVGLDPTQRFFSAADLAANAGVSRVLNGFSERRRADSDAPPFPDEQRALDISSALERVSRFTRRTPLPLVPAGAGEPFRMVGPAGGEPGTEPVQAALEAFGAAYTSGAPLEEPARAIVDAVSAAGAVDSSTARALRLELFYNNHAPWRMTSVAYALSIVLFGLSRLALRKPLVVLATLCGLWGVTEHILGISLRIAILGRAPVSNTYEALLWMGLVAIALGLVAQLLNRKGWYIFAGLCAAFVSVLFAGLIPLTDQTNALPAVLRSNFWLTIHVLTIVASYGVLAVASVLGHVYLIRFVLLARRTDQTASSPRVSHPLVVQTYRAIQIGLLLLTAGTILGGVWAADSWGRFWGWDPKETWALISCIVYFAVLHARHVRWLRDFGLAASAVLGFAAIVWTFYGVNYVMATGLHSYGFGTGGERWVGIWALAEAAFLIACRVRYVTLRRPEGQPDGQPIEDSA